VSDRGDIRERMILDGLQNLRELRAALVGELVGLEQEVQRKVLWRKAPTARRRRAA
jgi:hypothetical protein